MSIEIIKGREHVTETTYAYCFHWRNDHTSGFSFSCDKDGNLIPPTCEEAAENRRKCLDRTYDVVDDGIRPYTHSWVEPAIARNLGAPGVLHIGLGAPANC